MKLIAILALAFCVPAFAEEKPPGIPADYKLLYQQDFDTADALKDFAFTDANAWKWSDADGKPALELQKQSKYKPPFPSPFNIGLLSTKQFGDCIIEAQCMQTGKEYGHRDMVFVFGFQQPSKFYYAHIATKTDNVANQIHIVNEQPRKKITTATNGGNQWGLNVWRHVRIERTGPDIRVFFDDMSKPVMTASDATFGAGWVGFGSFDDTGKVSNIRIWGKEAVDKKAEPFPTAK